LLMSLLKYLRIQKDYYLNGWHLLIDDSKER